MTHIPQHLAIIMDGNGRWAQKHSLPRIEGHARGAKVSEDIVLACKERNIRYLTLYAFSEENWNRPESEVTALMELLAHYLVRNRPKMIREGIRFCAIGDLQRLPLHVRDEIENTRHQTCQGTSLTLILALSYGSQQEICRAANKLIEAGVTTLTPELLSSALDTSDFPQPDLLVRTSGECRISNFLLWQLAYAELYFTSTLWPDFDAAELDRALEAYSKRERRFGLTSHQLKAVAT